MLLQCVARCVAVCCIMYVAAQVYCCSVLHSALQCVAVWCSVVHCENCCTGMLLQCVAQCAARCVALCCSVNVAAQVR